MIKIINFLITNKKIWMLINIIIGLIAVSILTCSKERLIDNQILFYLFWFFAFSWSSFLGVYAYQIHTVIRGDVRLSYVDLDLKETIHQFIFNFGSALIGWVIVYNLIPIDIKSFNETKIILLIIAGISFTGYLPKVITLFKN